MTKAVRDRILKDSNVDIGDHLRNHIHLTNCIHLKNHMHKQSPILTDRSLMRDLIVLQRSRSLRDPTASPPSWHSPSVRENDPPPAALRDRPSRRDSHSSRVAPGEFSGGVRRPRKTNPDEASANSGSKGRRSSGAKQKKGKQQVPTMMMMTLSEQLDNNDSDGVVSSNVVRLHRRQEAPAKRRKFRRARRQQQPPPPPPPPHHHRATGDIGGGSSVVPPQNELSVASNNLGREEFGERSMSRAPGNGCGIPWNWSRIHHRGKTFLDMAGRSLSCGLSDPRLRKSDMPPEAAGDDGGGGSSSSSKSEALPLLVEGSGSQESSDNAAWARRYSGELGIYAGSLFKRGGGGGDVDDSDLASEARSGEKHKLKGRSRSRHQNLTQKYMPKTFRDLVGQNLVVQALSNAVAKRKVGLLYVFYGPHGTGKTSCARIFARALNCQSSEQPKPCGFCNSCVAHDSGKSRNIREVGPVSNFDFERIMDLLDNMVVSQLPSHHRVFIFDDCDTLSPECWSAVSKVIDRAPRRVVFVLVCSSLDVLPHIIISRCQKFFFPKLKDADIIYTLQWIATKEGLEIDKDALKLIASRSDGSLRDAEMTLEQLSLLGQRISVPLVQELVGLISDEKLVDLLDLALSADTVNTVKNLRVIMETGVEPLGLMSQLATIITDVLAGSYDYTRERPRRKFFRRHPLSKEDMEKLRQALKTLSEAEKQLRTSNDKLTWLTAALLQLAPDQQYLLPSSSADTSFDQSPLALLNNPDGRANVRQSGLVNDTGLDRQRHSGPSTSHQQTSGRSSDPVRAHGKHVSGKTRKGVEEIWLEVLEKIQYNGVKEFLYQEGKLVSVTFGAAPTVQLMFSSHLTKSTAEKFRDHILQAFELVLRSPVTIEIRCEQPKRDSKSAANVALTFPDSKDGQSRSRSEIPIVPSDNTRGGTSKKSEIVEIAASPKEAKTDEHVDGSHKKSAPTPLRERRNPCQSIVRSKVSLAHVIQQVEGCSQHSGWSKRKAVSIAEKLEQENLRLEPRSRSLLCWKATRVTRRKLSRLKIRARKPRSLLKYVSCGKCLSTKSPR